MSAVTVIASLLLVKDVLRPKLGQLRYSQGQWVWQSGEEPIAGTLLVSLDLQSYILASFTAAQSSNPFFKRSTQWFHLEQAHALDAAATASTVGVDGSRTASSTWMDLRRALYSRVCASDESVAA